MEKALTRDSVNGLGLSPANATTNAARNRSAAKKKPPAFISLVVWLGVVSLLVWGLAALSFLYAAIFTVISPPRLLF